MPRPPRPIIAWSSPLPSAAWALRKRRCSVKLYTDSKYVLQGITEWLRPNWKARGWRTAAREPVKNQDSVAIAGRGGGVTGTWSG